MAVVISNDMFLSAFWQDKGASEIVLKAMGRAINKTVTIAEIIKVREMFYPGKRWLMTLTGSQKVVTERTLKSFRTCLCSIYLRTMKCSSNMRELHFLYCCLRYTLLSAEENCWTSPEYVYRINWYYWFVGASWRRAFAVSYCASTLLEFVVFQYPKNLVYH